MLVLENGKMMWPAPLPPAPPPPSQEELDKKAEAERIANIPPDYKAPYISGAKNAMYLGGACIGMGMAAPDVAFSSMFTTFALSNIIGIQASSGEERACHLRHRF